MGNQVAEKFEAMFLSQSLSEEIADCDRNELAQLFLELFRNNGPVLEAGCGSGRWCAWFSKHGIQSDGIDWSHELCARAQRAIPGSRFIPCDMQNTPFEDGAYRGLIALGSIEHNVHGPLAALKEFLRVMQPGGVALITVPFGGTLRRAIRFLSRPALLLKSNNLIRSLFGKRPVTGTSLTEAHRETKAAWYPRFIVSDNGWHFYEYEFNKKQMRQFLEAAGFLIVKESVAYGNEGIYHNFGRLAGKWNPGRCDVDFTFVGLFLKKVIPASVCGHMLCYVVQKPSNRPKETK